MYDPFEPGLYDQAVPQPITPQRRRADFYGNFVGSFLSDTWPGQALRQRGIRSEMERMDRFPTVGEDWNPILQSDLRGYEQFIHRFADARSPGEVEFIKRMIDANMIGKRELEYGGAGWSRFLSNILDPVNLVPIPALGGIGFFRGALRGAGSFAATGVVSELAVQQLDPTYENGEFVGNLAANTLLGAAIGGPLGRFGRFRGEVPDRPRSARPAPEETRAPGTPMAEHRNPETLDAAAQAYHDGERSRVGSDGKDAQAAPTSPAAAAVDNDPLGFAAGFASMGKAMGETLLRDVIDRIQTNRISGPFAVDPLVKQLKEAVLDGRVKTVEDARKFLEPELQKHPMTRDTARRLSAMTPEELAAYEKRMFEAWADVVDPDTGMIKRHVAGYERAARENGNAVQRLQRDVAELEAKIASARNAGETGWATRYTAMLETVKDELKAARATQTLNLNARDRARAAAKEANGNWDDYMLRSAFGAEEVLARSGQMPWYRLVQNRIGGQLGRWIGQSAHRMAASPGLLTRGAERGIAPPPSVEYAAKILHEQWDQVVRSIQDQYLRYLGLSVEGRMQFVKEVVQQNTLDRVGGWIGAKDRLRGKMNVTDFMDAVGKAVIRKGDRDNPFVDLAARQVNEFNKTVFEEAKRLGVLKTAEQMQKHLDWLDQRIAGTEDRVAGWIGDMRLKIGLALEAAAKGNFQALTDLHRSAMARAVLNEAIGAPVADGHTRLYRVWSRMADQRVEAGAAADAARAAGVQNVPDWVKDSAAFKRTVDATGRWFASDPEEILWYWNHAKANGDERWIVYVDVPHKVANETLVSKLAGDAKEFSRRPDKEHFVPREVAYQATKIPLTKAAEKQLDEFNTRRVRPKTMVAWAERRLRATDDITERVQSEQAQLLIERQRMQDELDAWKGLGGDENPEWYFHTLYDRDIIERKRDVLVSRLIEYYRRNPFTYINGKRLELGTTEAALRSRAEETVGTILREAEFQNGLQNLDVRVPGEGWQETAERLRAGAKELMNEGRTEQAAIAERRANFIERVGAQGKGFGGFGQSSPMLTRKLSIPRELLLDAGDGESFIVTRADLVQEHYVSRMAPAMEMARAFEDSPRLDRTLSELKDGLDWEALRLADAEDPKALQRHLEEAPKIIQSFLDVRDKVLGNYGLGDNPSSWTRRAVSFATNFSALTHMGKAWLAALTDPAKITFTEGFTRTFGHLFDSATQAWSRDPEIVRWARKGGDEVKATGAALEVARSTRVAQIATENEHWNMGTKIERNMHSMTRFSFIVNLLAPWTDLMKRAGGGLAQSRIIEDSVAIAEGRAIPAARRELLTAAGIDEYTARSIAREWKAAGAQSYRGSMGNDFYLANTGAWTDQDLVRRFRAILGAQADTLVITPGAADRPNFMYRPWAKLAFQYRQFSMSATQRIAMAALQRPDKLRLSGIASLVVMGGLIDFIRSPDYASGDLGSRIYRAVELSGVTGIALDMNNALETASGNEAGIRPALGISPMLQSPSWAQQVGAVTGPASTLGMQLIWAFTSPDADGSDRARALRYLIPFNNNFLWGDFFSRAQRGIAGGLD